MEWEIVCRILQWLHRLRLDRSQDQLRHQRDLRQRLLRRPGELGHVFGLLMNVSCLSFRMLSEANYVYLLMGTANAKALSKPSTMIEVYCILYTPFELGLKATALVSLGLVRVKS